MSITYSEKELTLNQENIDRINMFDLYGHSNV